MRPTRLTIGLLALSVLASCGGDKGTGTSSGDNSSYNPYGLTTSGPGVLSVSPLDTTTVFAASPLGMLAPPGHVLPTDHVYISFVDPWGGNQQANDCSARPVRAAGSGYVMFTYVTESAGDTKVQIQMTKTFYYYYDHVLLKAGVGVGTFVNAGDVIGTTTGRCPSMDLGVIDLDVTAPRLFNTKRYSYTAHAASPYKYFSEPLRSFYLSRIRMYEGVPIYKEGRIDWGVAGKLSGDWFHNSIASDDGTLSMGPQGWPKSISFARDWFDSTKVRISIGGTIATPGVVSIKSTDPDPASVSMASGIVAYQTTPILGFIQAGWMLAQMIADDRIRVEYFAGATLKPAAFTGSAQDYVR